MLWYACSRVSNFTNTTAWFNRAFKTPVKIVLLCSVNRLKTGASCAKSLTTKFTPPPHRHFAVFLFSPSCAQGASWLDGGLSIDLFNHIFLRDRVFVFELVE